MRKRGTSKYHSKKTEVDGITFDSRKEAKRYVELKGLMEDGVITGLQRQVKYILIPAQKEPDTLGKRGGMIKGKTLERECSYLADFVYTVCETGETIVEDTKGVKTPDYIIKRKLMLWVHKIRIKEV